MKGNEADYGDFVLDRTESISLDAEDIAVLESSSGNEDRTRYHDGAPSEKKFRAGRISDDLRNALGIGKHDIPEYIYRMRRMGFIRGYPPGYLKKAIDRDDSNEVLKFHMVEDNLPSDGKSERPDSPPPIINADKMIYYCGFNQYYRDLRDYENFRVPPFHEFVAYHQEELRKMHARKLEERRRRREKETRMAKKRSEEMLEDGETPSPPIETCDTPKNVVRLGNDKHLQGCSTGIMLGTPVLTRKRNGEDRDLIEEDKPSLESFSKGIVPFEAHEEETPHKGFLKKIMSKLKKFTR
ncbi:hypothetical protein TELCIR_14214 [Teladorsagia circumcincta]|uniref:PSP proline-rich domain-containing protein n=1 Tax=Teladorsagia circumcincta TaxID=45464 RepID=A0A2G9U1L4_TELCI|nr:hypothetical protein TELCIR_14214 [Teladorsagia circumcincta]